VHLDGALRGQAASWSVAAGTYVVCYVEERVGGAVALFAGSISGDFSFKKCGDYELELNPPIDFAAPDLSLTHVAAREEGSLVPLEGVYNASFLAGSLACSPALLAATHIFLRTADGAYHRSDPRLALLANDLDAPAHGMPGSLLGLPRVPKSFVNAHSCSPLVNVSARGASLSYSSAPFELNATMARAFYELAGSLVYLVDGLRLEPPYDVSPCTGFSRWRRVSATGCASARCSTTRPRPRSPRP